MANKWNIPGWLENEIRERDSNCVYCGVEFTTARTSVRSGASWEHIVNDATIITRENIALCCRSCNSSKGQKLLSDWLKTNYCKEKGITANSVSTVVKNALAQQM